MTDFEKIMDIFSCLPQKVSVYEYSDGTRSIVVLFENSDELYINFDANNGFINKDYFYYY
jgi:hypothetical protein